MTYIGIGVDLKSLCGKIKKGDKKQQTSATKVLDNYRMEFQQMETHKRRNSIACW